MHWSVVVDFYGGLVHKIPEVMIGVLVTILANNVNPFWNSYSTVRRVLIRSTILRGVLVVEIVRVVSGAASTAPLYHTVAERVCCRVSTGEWFCGRHNQYRKKVV
jgi:hypothetical protein